MWELSEQEPENIKGKTPTHVRKDGAIIPVEVSRTFFTAGPMTLFCSIAREIQITPLTLINMINWLNIHSEVTR